MATEITYENQFYNSRICGSTPFIAGTVVKEYRGALICKPSVMGATKERHVVIDGKCSGMYAGPSGAELAIDNLRDGFLHYLVIDGERVGFGLPMRAK